VVVCSAGGQAVTGPGGRYRLAAAVPLDAERVVVTAVGAGEGSPAASADVAVAGGLVTVPPLSLALGAPCSESWLPVFETQPGTTGRVFALVVYDDGSGPHLYAGGEFETLGNCRASNLARWDGSRWSPVLGGGVPPNPNGRIQAMAVYDDGDGPDLYVAGTFVSTAPGAPRRIARWDGSSWSTVGAGLDDWVWSLTVFDDGTGPALYVGGEMPEGILRWDGAWSSVGGGVGGDVLALTAHDDGTGSKLYAGGGFATAGGQPASRVASWDGASWSPLGSGIAGTVHALAEYDDGGGPALYVGGSFFTAGGAPASRIARWDGTSWSALGQGLEPSGITESAVVQALSVFDAGDGPRLYVAGHFGRAGGAVARQVARWDGSSWSSIGDLVGDFYDENAPFFDRQAPRVLALATFADGSGPALFVGGEFEFADGRPATGLARYDGARWSNLGGNGVSDEVRTLVVHDGGEGPALYAGGLFTVASDVSAGFVAGWDGASWSPTGREPELRVAALASFDDGSGPALHASGGPISLLPSFPDEIVRWNGPAWEPLGANLESEAVQAMAVFDDGSGPALYVGGSLDSAGGAPLTDVARWDGASWSSVGNDFSSFEPRVLAVHDDGVLGEALYVGGKHSSSSGRVWRLDGASWTLVGGTLDDECRCLVSFDDGSGPALYAGGDFHSLGGVVIDGVARWDGSTWTALGFGLNGACNALAVFDGGAGPALYAGGSFTTAGGYAANGIARWDGTSWKPLGAGVDGDVFALCTFDGDGGPALFVGGNFPSGTEFASSFLAKWGCRETTPPTLTFPEGVVVLDPPSTPPGEVVHFVVKAFDDQDPAPTLVCDPPSGSLFPRGTTLVTCTAIDGSGNRATARFPVTVEVDAGTRGPNRR